jgi:peptide/nickel transport system permease protein
MASVSEATFDEEHPEVVEAEEEVTEHKKGIGVVGWIAVGWLVFILLVAIFGPLFQATPIENETGRVTQPCGDGSGLPIYEPFSCTDREAKNSQQAGNGAVGEVSHVLGVDRSGRDVLSLMIAGTRTTLVIAVGAVGGAVLVGGFLGLMSGYFRGKTDTFIAGIFDILLAFPQLILAFAIVAFLDRSVLNITFALFIVGVPLLGRITRASSLSWSDREFVIAAKALGAKTYRVVTREVLPNVMPALMAIALLAIGIAIVAEGSLSIIGLGVPPGTASWGSVLAAGGEDFKKFPHMVFIPSIAILITVMSLNLLGDAVRRKFDVKESAL